MAKCQSQEIPSSPLPVAVCDAVADLDHPVFLDSGMQIGRFGDYSFVSCRPSLILRSWGRRVESVEAGSTRCFEADPFEVLEEQLAGRRRESIAAPVPLTGGAIGYLGYDLGRLIEVLPDDTVDDTGIPEMYLGFYDAVYGYDHQRQRGYLCGDADSAGWAALEEAVGAPGQARVADGRTGQGLRCNFEPEPYRQAIARTIEYIAAGDIFQANISQRFDCELLVDPWELYKRLRLVNPAPFAAYLGFAGTEVVSASPERFMRVSGDRVQTRPIKGTRPRGQTEREDEALGRELLGSEKDRAELLMIIDLERNDLGRVCRIGTVKVPDLMVLESFPTVHHLVSTVVGRLREECSFVDLLRASFPGGSITGAPKIRSMEIIEELEPTRRGVYTGSIGYLSYDGEMDTSIVIRTVVVREGRAYFQVGGGIVADSTPDAEYVETLDKGRALARALDVESEAPFNHDSH